MTIIEPTGQIYTDQTGQFIAPSSNGNNYLLILYNYDSNSIHAEPLMSRSIKAIFTAYKTLHATLCKAGLHPKLQHLDNECSDALKDFMADDGIDFQPAAHPPPGSAQLQYPTINSGQGVLIPGLPKVPGVTFLPQSVATYNLRISPFT